MSSDSFPTPHELVDKVPLIKNPGFYVPKPVELPQDIHPLPDDVQAYFVYPHTLETHVLSTLPAALDALQQTHSQRLHLLASYADSKERARKARLNQVAPGWNEGGTLQPIRREAVSKVVGAGAKEPSGDLMGGGLAGGSADTGGNGAEGAGENASSSLLGGPQLGSPVEMGQGTADKMQRDLMLDFVDGLERMQVGSGGGGGRNGGGEVDDLI